MSGTKPCAELKNDTAIGALFAFNGQAIGSQLHQSSGIAELTVLHQNGERLAGYPLDPSDDRNPTLAASGESSTRIYRPLRQARS